MKSFKYALFFVVLTLSVVGIAWALGFANGNGAIEAGGRVIAVIFAVATSFAAIEIFLRFKKTGSDKMKLAPVASPQATSSVIPNATSSATSLVTPVSVTIASDVETKARGPQF